MQCKQSYLCYEMFSFAYNAILRWYSLEYISQKPKNYIIMMEGTSHCIICSSVELAVYMVCSRTAWWRELFFYANCLSCRVRKFVELWTHQCLLLYRTVSCHVMKRELLIGRCTSLGSWTMWQFLSSIHQLSKRQDADRPRDRRQRQLSAAT